jgi:hypothetical protein
MASTERKEKRALIKNGGRVRVQEHRRKTSLKLVKRRTAGSALRKTRKKGNQTTPP